MDCEKKKNKFTEIPKNAEVIDLDQSEDIDLENAHNNLINIRCDEKIQTAILTKSLDQMKKAIFACLLIRKTNLSNQKLEKTMNENYIKYFKEKLNISIVNECYNPRHEVPDPMADVNPRQIIVHGVDFLSDAQIQNRFRGVHGVKVQRINCSNVSIKFSEQENVENILEMERLGKINVQGLEEIQQNVKFKWIMLKKYDVLGFPRILKYRYASVQEQNLPMGEIKLEQFDMAKKTIHLSELFIQSDKDKQFFDEKMQQYELSLLPYRRNRSLKSRSQRSQTSRRERTRDNRNYRRQNMEIDGFRGRFGDRSREGRQGGYERGYQNNRGRDYKDRRGGYKDNGENGNYNNNSGYRTQRHNNNNNDRREAFTDRRRFDPNNNRNDFRRKNRYSDDQQNDKYKGNNNNNNYHARSNRFFDSNNKNGNNNRDSNKRSRSNSSKSISMSEKKRSVSRSVSNSSKSSYGLNKDVDLSGPNKDNTIMRIDHSISFNGKHDRSRLSAMNKSQIQNDRSIVLNDSFTLNNLSNNRDNSITLNSNNFTKSNNNIVEKDQSLSMIIPENQLTICKDKREEDDDESVGDILQKMDREQNLLAMNRSRSQRSISIGSRRSVRNSSKNSSVDWTEKNELSRSNVNNYSRVSRDERSNNSGKKVYYNNRNNENERQQPKRGNRQYNNYNSNNNYNNNNNSRGNNYDNNRGDNNNRRDFNNYYNNNSNNNNRDSSNSNRGRNYQGGYADRNSNNYGNNNGRNNNPNNRNNYNNSNNRYQSDNSNFNNNNNFNKNNNNFNKNKNYQQYEQQQEQDIDY